jgi:acid phosphatase family membrane protein YuiD
VKSFIYIIAPFFAWLVAGTIKFVVNSLKAKRLAFDLIGYGGLPSNHSSIVTCTTALIAMQEGLDHPAFLGAITFAFIVMLDAASLRRQVGKHAATINELLARTPGKSKLRERVGHSKIEIVSGVIVGVCCAYVLHLAIGLA